MLSGILLTIQILVGLTMGGLILIQRSEGGALGMGGGPSGLVSARGAGNILTRATMILAVIFFANSIGLTIIGNLDKKSQSAISKVDTTKITQTPISQAPQQAAQAAQDASESANAKPSLSDLPLAVAPSAAPASTSASSATLSSKVASNDLKPAAKPAPTSKPVSPTAEVKPATSAASSASQ